jgi:hypothetical protein
MCTIAESNVIFLAEAELPTGFKVASEEFREGWNRMRTGGARRLERKLRKRGWNFIRTGDDPMRSGVGKTSQEAIANALKLAVRRAGAHSNAVEVERIQLTQYPWFFLARLCVHLYRIQQGAALPVPVNVAAAPIAMRQGRLPSQRAHLYADLGNMMPMLKEMLTSSVSSQASSAARAH